MSGAVSESCVCERELVINLFNTRVSWYPSLSHTTVYTTDLKSPSNQIIQIDIPTYFVPRFFTSSRLIITTLLLLLRLVLHEGRRALRLRHPH